jgi:hypothetical protein
LEGWAESWTLFVWSEMEEDSWEEEEGVVVVDEEGPKVEVEVEEGRLDALFEEEDEVEEESLAACLFCAMAMGDLISR